jgi:hypothetical protein
MIYNGQLISDLTAMVERQERRASVVVKTSHDYPPIPIRTIDWSAYDDNSYDADYVDGNYVSDSIVGYGATEAEAIADFWARWDEKFGFDPWEPRECTDRDCPIVGLHNTDECANLIHRAWEEWEAMQW